MSIRHVRKQSLCGSVLILIGQLARLLDGLLK